MRYIFNKVNGKMILECVGEHDEVKQLLVGQVSEWKPGSSFKFSGEMIVTLYKDDEVIIPAGQVD